MHVLGMGFAEIFVMLWYLVILAVFLGAMFLVVKAAVRSAIKDAKRDGDL